MHFNFSSYIVVAIKFTIVTFYFIIIIMLPIVRWLVYCYEVNFTRNCYLLSFKLKHYHHLILNYYFPLLVKMKKIFCYLMYLLLSDLNIMKFISNFHRFSYVVYYPVSFFNSSKLLNPSLYYQMN